MSVSRPSRISAVASRSSSKRLHWDSSYGLLGSFSEAHMHCSVNIFHTKRYQNGSQKQPQSFSSLHLSVVVRRTVEVARCTYRHQASQSCIVEMRLRTVWLQWWSVVLSLCMYIGWVFRGSECMVENTARCFSTVVLRTAGRSIMCLHRISFEDHGTEPWVLDDVVAFFT